MAQKSKIVRLVSAREIEIHQGLGYFRTNAAILARFRYILPNIDLLERNRLVRIARKMTRKAEDRGNENISRLPPNVPSQ